MPENVESTRQGHVGSVLLVDDEHQFRTATKKQLELRGYSVLDVDNGEDAIKTIRHKRIEVVILDQKMPKMDGVQTLKEIKRIKPEVQVIMLTGFGSIELAKTTGKHDVYHFMQKPCSLDELIDRIEDARKERVYAMARHEIPEEKKGSLWKWLAGSHNRRPGLIILGLAVFAGIVAIPTPQKLGTWLGTSKTGEKGEGLMGYAEYRKMEEGQTIPEYYSQKAEMGHKVKTSDGKVKREPLTMEQTAFRAKAMVGILAMAVIFWASGAIPVGMTALMVCAFMFFFGVLPPNKLAQAFVKDSVIFIFGVLVIGNAIGKTGLDRRIGTLLLGTKGGLRLNPLTLITNLGRYQADVTPHVPPMPNVPFYGHWKAAAHLVRVLEGQEELRVQPAEVLNVIRALEALYQSAAERREIRTDLADDRRQTTDDE